MAKEQFDAVVIGSGPTGGWVARKLTEGGYRVVVIEAGPSIDDLGPPKGAGGSGRNRQLTQSKHPAFNDTNAHLFIDDLDNPYSTPDDRPYDWIRGRQVGGRSLTWGGVTLRFSDYEFQPSRHDDFGEDWPITHRELAPYYDEVEEFLGVRGSIEGLAQLPDGRFLPPAPMTPAELRLKAYVEGRWPTRRVISTRAIPRVHPTRPADGPFPAFASNASTLRAAMMTGRLTLKSETIASHLELDPATGRIRRLVAIDAKSRAPVAFEGRIFVSCASTIETTRLLLNSACPQHPRGIGNASGTLGRYLMDHPTLMMWGVAKGFLRSSDDLDFGGPNSIYIPRFRNVTEPSSDFLRGYGIWGGMQRKEMQETKRFAPFAFLAHAEMLPREENQVSIDPARKDAWGIPVVRIECQLSPNEHRMLADAEKTLREMADGLELYVVGTKVMTPGLMVHEVGTARMGRDPARSVLDPHNRCHEVSNLFVADGAAFVTAGWQNPTLTMMALAARCADYILENGQRD